MPEPSARFTLITAARLLDGTGTAPVEGGALLIEGDRIVGLGRAAQVRVPDGASVDRRDYGASTILPGFVDAHCHVSMLAYLLAGADCSPEAAPDVASILDRLARTPPAADGWVVRVLQVVVKSSASFGSGVPAAVACHS